ncbi:hypothetical protein E2C01_024234 [Portunus trituberculatus]|uniref:Uncharacterized protein n=1 Tax=Portunus trituberculatus TaxID=210409 RepID=A0A5B7EA48_PORTR|nr:hypothetical protein [Portunus trituberculatus]
MNKMVMITGDRCAEQKWVVGRGDEWSAVGLDFGVERWSGGVKPVPREVEARAGRVECSRTFHNHLAPSQHSRQAPAKRTRRSARVFCFFYLIRPAIVHVAYGVTGKLPLETV